LIDLRMCITFDLVQLYLGTKEYASKKQVKALRELPPKQCQLVPEIALKVLPTTVHRSQLTEDVVAL